MRQKFLKNSNSFGENGGDFHAIAGVVSKKGHTGNFVDVFPGTHAFFQSGKPRWITERSPSNEAKVDCFTLEMMISDAFTLTDTSVTFWTATMTWKL